jgi:hypothetical protein
MGCCASKEDIKTNDMDKSFNYYNVEPVKRQLHQTDTIIKYVGSDPEEDAVTPHYEGKDIFNSVEYPPPNLLIIEKENTFRNPIIIDEKKRITGITWREESGKCNTRRFDMYTHIIGNKLAKDYYIYLKSLTKGISVNLIKKPSNNLIEGKCNKSNNQIRGTFRDPVIVESEGHITEVSWREEKGDLNTRRFDMYDPVLGNRLAKDYLLLLKSIKEIDPEPLHLEFAPTVKILKKLLKIDFKYIHVSWFLKRGGFYCDDYKTKEMFLEDIKETLDGLMTSINDNEEYYIYKMEIDFTEYYDTKSIFPVIEYDIGNAIKMIKRLKNVL